MSWRRVIKDYRDPHYFQNVAIKRLEGVLEDLNSYEEDEIEYIDSHELGITVEVLEKILKHIKAERDPNEKRW